MSGEARRIWNDDHTAAVYVATSSGGGYVIVGTDDGSEDVWLSPASARALAAELQRRAKELTR